VHPGGPYWKRKDLGAWSIPKGEYDEGEDPLEAARREFAEELGSEAPDALLELTPVRQRSGKRVVAWAALGDLDPSQIKSNTFELEWPPKSGRTERFPEIDRAEWFALGVAARRINPAQAPFLTELAGKLGVPWPDPL